MKRFLLFLMVVSLLIPGLSFAQSVKYQVVEVKNGGAIKGKVISAKKVNDPVIPIKVKPKESPQETELEKKTCGASQQAMMYVISTSNEVKNVLVIVEGVEKGKAVPKKDLVIDNKGCMFEPLVGISYVTSNYVIKNSDPIFHNTSLGVMLEGGLRRSVYNLALPYKDQVIEKPNRVVGPTDIKCDAHPWMRAYVYSSRHPYVAITDEKGNYEIKDLLPGKYRVRFWHEGFKEIVNEVEVKAGEVSNLNITFTETVKPNFLEMVE